MVGVNASRRSNVGIHSANAAGLNAQGLAQIQRPKSRIKIMAKEIPNGRGAKVPEIAPAYRIILRAVGAHFARPKPQIPIHPVWHRFLWWPARQVLLVPAGSVRPGVDFTNISQCARPNDFARFANKIARMPLVAHLRGHTRFLGNFGNLARLPYVMRQRLFTIDMFALAHGPGANVGVQMIRRRAQHRVNGFFLFQHDAKILIIGHFVIGRGLGVMFFNLLFERQSPRVAVEIKGVQILMLHRISHRDDLGVLLLKEGVDIGLPLPAAADDRNVHFLTGRDKVGSAEDVPRHNAQTCHNRGSRADEFAPAHASAGNKYLFHTEWMLLLRKGQMPAFVQHFIRQNRAEKTNSPRPHEAPEYLVRAFASKKNYQMFPKCAFPGAPGSSSS